MTINVGQLAQQFQDRVTLGDAHADDNANRCVRLEHFLQLRTRLQGATRPSNTHYTTDFTAILAQDTPVAGEAGLWAHRLGVPDISTMAAALSLEEASSSNSSNTLHIEHGDGAALQTSCIGEGACGLVYKVESRRPVRLWDRTAHVFAVKRFSPRVLNEDVKYFYEKIVVEYECGRLLCAQHPNFIQIYGLFVDQYGPFPGAGAANGTATNNDEYHHELAKFPKFTMVMEYGEFDFIDLVLQDRAALSQHEIHCYFKQLVNAVAFLHNSCNMVHRDLKLDNCIISRPGVLKLIDFGSTILLDSEPGATEAGDAGQYLNTIVGSDPYLAPEILCSRKYLAKPVDVWAIGIIYYCMIMKSFPWKIPRKEDVCYKLFSHKSESPSYDTDTDSEDDFYNFKNDLDDSDDDLEALDDLDDVGDSCNADSIQISRGPNRVLRHFNPEIRQLIGGILTIDPRNRSTISDIVSDPVFQSIHCCFESFQDVENYETRSAACTSDEERHFFHH